MNEKVVQSFETSSFGVYGGAVLFEKVETVTKRLSDSGVVCCWLYLLMQQLDEPDPSRRTNEQYLYCGKPEDGWETDGKQVWNTQGRKWSAGIGAGKFVQSLEPFVTQQEKDNLPVTGWEFLEGKKFFIEQPEQKDRDGNVILNNRGYPQREFIIVGRDVETAVNNNDNPIELAQVVEDALYDLAQEPTAKADLAGRVIALLSKHDPMKVASYMEDASFTKYTKIKLANGIVSRTGQ